MANTKKQSLECCSPDRSEIAKRWTLAGLGSVALALSLASIRTCNFISLEGENSPFSKGFGIFKQDVDGQCKGYSQRTDGGHAMAKAFGLLAVLAIAGAVTCVLASTLCLKKNNKLSTLAWQSGRALFAGGLYSVLFTFFIYTSPLKRSVCSIEGTECKAGPGAIITAVNSCLLAVLTILAMLTMAPNTNGGETAEKQDRTTEQKDEEVGSTNTWFGSSNAPKDTSMTTQADAAVSSADGTKKRGWFGTKAKVATGAVVAGGAAVAATRAVGEDESKSSSFFGKSKTSNPSMTIEPVEEEASKSWFATQDTTKEEEKMDKSSEKKRGWFGSRGKVATGETQEAAAVAAVAPQDKSQRSFFSSNDQSTATAAEPAEASTSKRSLFSGSMFRRNHKASTNDDTNDEKNVQSPENAETRRALFGSDVDSATTGEQPKSVVAKKPKAKAQSPAAGEAVVVSNETVNSSCPACYCLP